MSYYYMDKISISPDETFSLHLSKAGKQRSLVSAYTEALLRWQIIDSSCSSAGFNWSLRSTPEYPTMHRAGPGAVHCWILRRTPERPIEPFQSPSLKA